MESNIKIIYPQKTHKYTLVLLHGMYNDNNSFNNFFEYLKSNKYLSSIFSSCKFIIPNSPTIDLHYSKLPISNCNSWYDYFTYYDNQNKIDNIGLYEFHYESYKISNLIFNETKYLSPSKIFLLGVSQGGTLIFNILNKLSFNIGGLICINSIYMKKYINLSKKFNKTPIFIYSVSQDEIYPLKLQRKCFEFLKKKKFNITWHIDKKYTHCDESFDQYNFIIRSIC